MTDRKASYLVTLSDLHGHPSAATLFECDF